MCGIAALFAAAPQPLEPLVRRMTELIRHRGPDDEGVALFEQTALGNRRLAIVDLSPAGHQPMSDHEGRCWVTYNGEIYNHLELRAELEARGHRFRSHTDTEIILAGYREWGEECLQRFNGMFAFVLVDRSARRVFAARDRFGVKPLYYWRSPQGLLAFASEIKQFTALPGWQPRLNGQLAYDFLNWAVLDHGDGTLFEGVQQLRGGEFMHCSLEEVTRAAAVRRWYHFKPAPFAGSFAEATARFAELFTDSVRLRLRADVPVGSCLSGGLDSSSIVCVANRLLRQSGAVRQETFSACAHLPQYDEREYIGAVVQATGVAGHQTFPELDGLFASLDRVVWHQDEPFGSTSIFAQWKVFALAAEARVKVLLDGQGADELLAGYAGFRAPHFASLLRSFRWAELVAEMRAAGPRALQYLANGVLPEVLRQPLRCMVGKPAAAPAWLDAGRLGIAERDPFGQPRSVNEMSVRMLTATAVPMLLHWEDRDSMAHSVESRLPFLDYRLAEFVAALPAEYKLRRGTTKRVLREALAGTLPEKVRARTDKMGFVTPEEHWMKSTPQPFRAEVRRAIDAGQGIVRPAAAELLEAMLSGARPFDFSIWRIISFGRWMARFGVRAV